MKKRALIVGINYAGTSSELRGCINDANNIKLYLESKDFSEIEMLIEEAATTAGILAGLKRLVAGAEPGDTLVFHYSGHGSQLYSTVEEDKLDEIICPIDLNWKDRVITDNQLKDIFNPVPNGVNITVILDCCHSGSALDQHESAAIQTKAADAAVTADTVKVVKSSLRSRFMKPPAEIVEKINDEDMKLRNWDTSRDVNKTALLIAGCMPNQTSADAKIDGIFQGAATYAILKKLKSNPESSYLELVESMNSFMISNRFTQRPQLDGNSYLYDKQFLSSWADAAPAAPEEAVSTPVAQENIDSSSTNVFSSTGIIVGVVLIVLAIMFL